MEAILMELTDLTSHEIGIAHHAIPLYQTNLMELSPNSISTTPISSYRAGD